MKYKVINKMHCCLNSDSEETRDNNKIHFFYYYMKIFRESKYKII